ncbi:hypothetical protein PS631_02839 [Pseudomonas fluorescens]|uniref:Uncharacterized protein n=1 Tax=Pseudomonas fluorescens TaxID=294 RepID=A0A5E6TD11_PSEFL|nr:hypothetical protein PS631_02839 [Pseudomonas fluorescens]
MWPKGCPYRQSLQRWLTPHGLEVNITSIASYGISGFSGFSFADLAPVQNYFICNKHLAATLPKTALRRCMALNIT